MSAEESNGSHSLTSFAAQLEQTIPQSPLLKKMASSSRRRLGTARDLPQKTYDLLKTPPHETDNQRKLRIQKITRAWAKRWATYEWVNPQHEEMFVVNPPIKTLGIRARQPPPEGIIPDPTTLKTHDDFPEAYQ